MRAFPDYLKKALKLAKAEGWTVSISGKGHYKWTRPDGHAVTTSKTTEYPRAQKNNLAKLRRFGLNI